MSEDGVVYEVVVRRKADGEVTGERVAGRSNTPQSISTLVGIDVVSSVEGLARQLEAEARPEWRWEKNDNEWWKVLMPDGQFAFDGTFRRVTESRLDALVAALNALED